MWRDLFWVIRKLSSRKEKTETGIFRFFTCFLKIWKTGNKYRANKIGKSTEPCPISTLTSKKGKEKLFQRYLVFLPTR